MLKFWCLLLLPFVLLEGIVCPSVDTPTLRRNRFSSYETIPNVNNFMDTFNSAEHRLGKPAQQQQQPTAAQSLRGSTAQETIANIFQLGPGEGVVLFTTTPEPYIKSDDSFIDRSSNQQQIFKVQRSPDGKLNVVYNDPLFLQKRPDGPPAGRNPANDFVLPDRRVNLQDTVIKCDEAVKTEGKRFCDKVPNYPSQAQLEVLLKDVKGKFGVFFDSNLPTGVQQRMNSDPVIPDDDQYFCQSIRRTVYPESGRTKDSNWALIVNDNNDNRQAVVVEECVNPNAECEISKLVPLGFTTHCKQHYSYRPLVAISANGTVVREYFELPSCCKCAYKKTRRSF